MGDRITLVTGASSGIGREIVRELAKKGGHILYITARRQENLQALVDEFPKAAIHCIAGDLVDESFRRGLIKRVVDEAGRLDVLINNAGFSTISPFEAHSLVLAQKVITLNVTALIELCQAAVQTMLQQGGGRILNVSSVLGFFAMPYQPVYVASKHAVNGFTSALRLELRGTNVRVSCVNPGSVDTEFIKVAADKTLPRRMRGARADKVARSIVRQLDRNWLFLYPNWSARLLCWTNHAIPRLMRFVMSTLVKKEMRKMFGYDDPKQLPE